MFRPRFRLGDVRVLARETCHDGFFRLDRLHLRHALFGGGESPPLMRELFVRGEAVAVLPYDPAADAVVLVEQFRVGALAHPAGPWLLEIVAGVFDHGESAEAVARREVREETGCEATALWPLGRFYTSPGASSERILLYLARVRAPAAGGVFGLAEEGEDIRSHVLPLAEALAGIEAGWIEASYSIIALQWLALHRTRVRAAWAEGG
ncbi:NUDIX domain-containing protein [Inmirania thermothiophila]|uniref:ADP-ribose pyrophosphatase n=1 Tax=Inmirania thermothiophila TaxID=1750597 RepID=A0A3N1Y4T2_9GAMM|nr:NUDIX domain-containing protein [Inmirania thermothiophila]ROR32297.1 ADP-ribose pyrophosphatase [Inmirania thermothiophila]